jgi:SOS-response transcriptional repressor LexA
METPADRLRQLRTKRGFKTATDAASYYGWPVTTYRAHENGGRDISRKAAAKYAAAYRTSIDFLLLGKGISNRKNDNVSDQDIASQPIPVLSYAAIASVNNKKSMLQLKSAESVYVPRKTGITGSARSITVEDSSALDVGKAYRHSLEKGDTVIFDPDQKPKPGSLVVAYHPEISAAAPRIYAERSRQADDGVDIELIPLNPAFRTVRMREGDGSYICGVVISYMRSVISL